MDKTASFSPSKNLKGNFYTRSKDFKQALMIVESRAFLKAKIPNLEVVWVYKGGVSQVSTSLIVDFFGGGEKQ